MLSCLHDKLYYDTAIVFTNRLMNILQQANPSDILLFHKRRSAEAAKRKGASNRGSLNIPTEPEDLDETNIEDLITDNLEKSDKKLELLDEKTMGEGKSICCCLLACRLEL